MLSCDWPCGDAHRSAHMEKTYAGCCICLFAWWGECPVADLNFRGKSGQGLENTFYPYMIFLKNSSLKATVVWKAMVLLNLCGNILWSYGYGKIFLVPLHINMILEVNNTSMLLHNSRPCFLAVHTFLFFFFFWSKFTGFYLYWLNFVMWRFYFHMFYRNKAFLFSIFVLK